MAKLIILKVKGTVSACPEEWGFHPEDLQKPSVHGPGFPAQHGPEGAGRWD